MLKDDLSLMTSFPQTSFQVGFILKVVLYDKYTCNTIIKFVTLLMKSLKSSKFFQKANIYFVERGGERESVERSIVAEDFFSQLLGEGASDLKGLWVDLQIVLFVTDIYHGNSAVELKHLCPSQRTNPKPPQYMLKNKE